MAFPAIAAAAVGSKLLDKGIDYAFGKQVANNNQKIFEKNQKTAFDLSQKAQQDAFLNQKVGAKKAGFSTSLLNGTPQAAATTGGSAGTQTSSGGGEPTISTAFKSQAAAQENKLARRLLEAQVITAENTAEQSKIKTASDTIGLTNTEDENRNLTDNYKGYLQRLINQTDQPEVKSELQAMLDSGNFTAGALKGNQNFLSWLKQSSDLDLSQVANEYQKTIAQQNLKNGNAAFIAAMPKQEFLSIIEKLRGLEEDNKNKKLTGEQLNAEIQHIDELINETVEKTDSIKNSNWYKMQKTKNSGFLTAQFLNELSKSGPQMIGDAASDVIGLVKTLMPTSTITEALTPFGMKRTSTVKQTGSVPLLFPK